MATVKLTHATLADGQTTDLLLDDAVIKEIDTAQDADTTIDLAGKLVLPGVIDTHVHFRQPGGEHKETWATGSAAAVAGGVTTVLEMPNTNPPTIDLQSLDQKRAIATQHSLVNFGLYLGATPTNGDVMKNITGSCGVKIYVGSSTGNLLVAEDEQLRQLFAIPTIQWVVHAEDEATIQRNTSRLNPTEPQDHSQVRSPEAAAIAVERVIKLARETGARVHIAHASTAAEVELIRQAKGQGIRITAEVSPHHLFLSEDDYARLGMFAKVNPPLRTAADQAALWQGLNDGTIDTVATDHAPHTVAEKRQAYTTAPSGLPEVETSLPLMLQAVADGKLTMERLVMVMATRPAQIFQLARRGAIKEGYFADLVVVDPKLTRKVTANTLHSQCGWTPYEGMTIIGWPVMTLINGQVAYRDGEINKTSNAKEVSYGTI